jgi:hypothetical protein
MRKHKKALFIALAAVLVLGATLGTVAFAQADDQATNQTSSNTLMEKVATIYQQNTGTNIDPTELQKAFEQAQKDIANDRLDAYLQKLVDAGKITAQQKQDYETWLNSRPTQSLTDEYKQWLQSAPQNIPGLTSKGDIGPGAGTRLPAMPRGFNPMGKMFRGWCAPDKAE